MYETLGLIPSNKNKIKLIGTNDGYLCYIRVKIDFLNKIPKHNPEDLIALITL